MNSTLLKLINEKYKQRNFAPFHNPVNTSPKSNTKDAPISTKELIDVVTDNLIECKETIIQDANKVLPTSLLLQRELETRDLHAINFMHFE